MNHVGLPLEVIETLRAVAAKLQQSGTALVAQAELATVMEYSATYIRVEVGPESPKGDWPKGPLEIKPLVTGEDGDVTGEILVWVEDGKIALIEQAWFTDQPPAGSPSIERVLLSGPS